ncbi:LCP family protein [Sanguibacter antarcticus]|uniref:LytR family transcriptional attenuator n=1 Tax=Sanguibacter antarcticus TaxID=372484 RepID=A0A2A9E2S9_9MICO|nr:LCP family protein [Sanguibacter antarcticus]PFG32500.1 LytR family transcriptional attenuator [Sanguibacter antarcticus]
MTPSNAPSRAALREQDAEAARRRPAHARSERSHRILRATSLAVVGVFAFAASAAGAVYYTLQSNIESVDVSALLGNDPAAPEVPTGITDPNAGLPITLLLLGSDDRSGVNAEIGGEVDGARSDTTIVLHISADRSRMEMVSIPRDSRVDIPSCTMTDGTTTNAAPDGLFNAAFAYGFVYGGDIDSAIGCTMKTVQSLTGLTLDGFALVDFAGFQGMIDAIGGVSICIPEDIASPDAGLYLTAGQQTLDGVQALGLARARKGTGANMDGSDLNRIGRQQELLAATMRTILDKNVLTNAPDLLQFLNAATSSLTASPDLASIPNMSGLAYSLRTITSDKITFMTIPIADDPTNKNHVVWTSAADTVWANMVADQPIVTVEEPEAEVTDPATTDTETPAEPTTPTEPTTVETKDPGQEAFTSADITSVCG